MMGKIKIEVFGIKSESPLGGCDCGGACGPTDVPTMGEMFSEFENFIKASEVKDQVVVEFVDLLEDDLTGYDHAKPVIERGYKLPLTFINKRAIYAGGIDNKKILIAVQKLI